MKVCICLQSLLLLSYIAALIHKMYCMQLHYPELVSDESWGKWRVFEQGLPIPASYS